MAIFLFIFSLFALGLRWLLQYTTQTVGDKSPLKRPVRYAYSDSYIWWRETLWVLPLILLSVWICWLLLTILYTATQIWHYPLVVAFLALTAFFVYLLSRLYWVENQLTSIIYDTTVQLDPATQSVIVSRAGTDTVLTTATVAVIEFHAVTYGRFCYHYYRFIDQNGCVTPVYNYGKGLPFGIEAYFNGVSVRRVTHSYPSTPLPLS